jgi:hypothetical protein
MEGILNRGVYSHGICSGWALVVRKFNGGLFFEKV